MEAQAFKAKFSISLLGSTSCLGEKEHVKEGRIQEKEWERTRDKIITRVKHLKKHMKENPGEFCVWIHWIQDLFLNSMKVSLECQAAPPHS